MKKLVVLLCTLWAMLPVNAQYTVLHNFGSFAGDGKSPEGSLTLSGSQLFGMTMYGGTYNDGCVFSIDTNGNNYKILLSFDTANGLAPMGSLLLLQGKLYGMTAGGGVYKMGIIFSIDTNGNGYKDLFDFDSVTGEHPWLTAFVSSGKTLYGTTAFGGASPHYNGGVVFSIDTNGANYKILEYTFDNDAGNVNPMGPLTLSGSKLYGMCWGGGYGGAVFSIDTNGNNYTVLYPFPYKVFGEGQGPYGGVTLSGNKLYGMTAFGGLTQGTGTLFSLDTNGTDYTDMVNFNETNGAGPYGSLILIGGSLYGMTCGGGTTRGGVIFSIDTNGSGYRDLYNFNWPTGSDPLGSLTASGSMLYGMTYAGGPDTTAGVIFKFNYVTAGISNLSPNNTSIKVYPNPSNGIFNIIENGKWKMENTEIEIYNVLGELIYNEPLKQVQGDNTIDLSGQPNGVYLYRVITETGNLVGEGKVVIER